MWVESALFKGCFMMSAQLIKIMFFCLIAVAVAFEVVGDVFFKRWSIEGKNVLLAVGLLIYFIGTVFWAVSLKYEYLSKAISVFTVMNLVIVALVGMIYFKEDLSSINKLGIALGVLSVILIEM
jgi:small multidrug resistance pump